MKNNIDLIIDNLINFINIGKTVSFPTETVYALCCDANNINAINKIYSIKQRDLNKLFSVFVNINFLDDYVFYNTKFRDLIYSELDNGTTVILKKKNNNILPFIQSETVGIRYPKNNFIRKFLKKMSLAIIATSVNLSGEQALCNYVDIIRKFSNKIDYIVDNDVLNIDISGKPSKIISIIDDKIKIIRD